MKPHPYVEQHIHYTWDITATICVLTDSEDIIVWCIENITPTLFMTLLLPYVWHPLHYTKHHILTLWPQTTMFMSSHPLYWTSCPLYLCHHIHSIDDITPTEFLRSLLLYMTISYPWYMTSQPLNVCHHTHPFNDITPSVCRTSHPLYV